MRYYVMIILGIDPGYAIVGYGVLEYKNNNFSVIDYGAILTDAKTPFNERLEIIYDRLYQIIEKYKPDAMSVEKVFYNSNAKTVIDVISIKRAFFICCILLISLSYYKLFIIFSKIFYVS